MLPRIGRNQIFIDAMKLVFVVTSCLTSFSVQPFGNYLTDFNNTYGTLGSRIDNCGLCHNDFNGGGVRTSYGEDFRNNNYSIVNIGLFDSDGDGFNNDQESSLVTLTSPGFSCLNLADAVNGPANLFTFVDPSKPACIGPGLPPQAKANGPYVAVTGTPVSFNSAGSVDPDGFIVSYNWNFGGVYGSSTEANPVFTFNVTSESKINVTLTVIDNDGNSTSSTVKVIVLMAPNSAPVANAGLAVSGVVNTAVEFNGTASNDPDGDQFYFVWEFGDGSTSMASRPLHTFNRCGIYNVLLTVSDIHSLTDTDMVTATIGSSGVGLPVANAGGIANHYDGNVGSNVQFDGSTSLDTDCNIVSYSWNFGDGTMGSGAKPVHSYSLAGDYVVTLTVTDNDGLNASATATVTILDAGALNGTTLYANNCAACHGAGSGSNKIGATVARINTGITTVASMNSLATILSAAEIQAIADYLASLTAPPPATDGPTLYANNCAACHGAGSASTKIGATVTRISTGITSVASMNYLNTLSAVEVQAIADYLASLSTTPPPTTVDGPTLYANSCAACHGAGSASTKIGATVTRINTGITTVASMNYLSTLTATEVQAIADYLTSLNTTPPPTTVDGATLYANSCAACHGAGSASTKIGATVTRINTGITSVASMNYLNTLSAVEVQAIADYLASLSTTPPPTTVDGPTLYVNSCAACHGAGSASTKIGATVTRINTGITSVASMNYLSTLTTAEIQAIADYLASLNTTPPPTTVDGPTLYANSCAACHGAGSNSTKAGATVARINNGITGVAAMNYLSTLTATEVQAIADYLSATAPPTTPSALYQSYCASCHGADGSGGSSGVNVISDSANTISSAINSVSAMNSLNFLTSAQVQSISDFLNGATTPPTTTDGATLYANSCSACHGAAAATTKGGAGVTRINTGISNVASMNYLSSLTATQVQAIANYLAQFAPSGGGSSVPHTDNQGDVGHAIDKDSPYSSGCTACHGTSLQGAVGPSCTSCHSVQWNETAPSGGGSSVPHTDNQGDVGHAIDKDSPYSSGCTACHGTSLQGAIGPSCTSCHGQDWSESAPPSGGSLNGESLYSSYCAACHGASTNSTKTGAGVTRINNGIASVSSMNSLASLSSAQIQAIADFLTGGSSPPPATTDGATLYANSCATCHGAGTSSTKAGASVTRIIGGITGIGSVSSMSYLSSLTVAQVQAMSDYLVSMGSSTPPPTTTAGSTLYASNCAACHGADSNSSKVGATVIRINTGITSVASMNYLNTMTAAEIQAVSDYLISLNTTTPPPTTTTGGATLYTNNCAACHGPGDSSAKAGATVSRINAGIASASSMNYLSTVLSTADIQAIADYLATTPPSGGGTTVAHTDYKDGVGHAIDKDTPFSSGCTSCHGTSLQGAVGPSCTSCHDVKWNESAPSGGGSVAHTDYKDGVGHAIDKDTPFSSGCTSCHGTSLQGAIGPSCTSCHDVKWNESASSGSDGD